MSSFFHQEKLEVLFDGATLAARVAELGREITVHYAPAVARGEELVVVGVLKGSFLFLADLVRQIDAPCHIEFMGVSSYGDATESSGVVQVTQDLTRPIKDKHVLLVEDIVDTGLTMKYLLANLTTRGPRSVKLASLLEKPSKNTAGIKADFLGFSIPDRFVVGYGLDAAGLYRNLPYVGLVKPPKSEGKG
jgi:hypoxanthine phosphoribosyltransferase